MRTNKHAETRSNCEEPQHNHRLGTVSKKLKSIFTCTLANARPYYHKINQIFRMVISIIRLIEVTKEDCLAGLRQYLVSKAIWYF